LSNFRGGCSIYLGDSGFSFTNPAQMQFGQLAEATIVQWAEGGAQSRIYP